MRIYINEGTTTYHALAFFDAAGDPVTPEALRYRLTRNNGVELIAWTALPADTTEIEIPAAMNLITTAAPGRRRHLTVEATHDGGKIITEELDYYLRDLRGYSPSA